MKLQEALALRVSQIVEEKQSNVCKISLGGGMSPSNIYDLQKGRTSKTTIDTVAKFCDGAGVSLGEFFDSVVFEQLDLLD